MRAPVAAFPALRRRAGFVDDPPVEFCFDGGRWLGGIAHGPVVRSHAFKLPKQVRALGLKVALSAKAAQPEALWVVPTSSLPTEPKSKAVAQVLRRHGWDTGRTLVFVGADEPDLPFQRASRYAAVRPVPFARGNGGVLTLRVPFARPLGALGGR